MVKVRLMVVLIVVFCGMFSVCISFFVGGCLGMLFVMVGGCGCEIIVVMFFLGFQWIEFLKGGGFEVGGMIILGMVSVVFGEMDVGCFEVGEFCDGGSVGLFVVVINGVLLGKMFYMQVVLDGDEFNGVGVIQWVVLQFDFVDIFGVIFVVGIVNYYVFQVV